LTMYLCRFRWHRFVVPRRELEPADGSSREEGSSPAGLPGERLREPGGLPAAMGEAEPAGIMTMPPPVTPCGRISHPTVLDRGSPQITPPPRAAMLVAPTRSRCPTNPQPRQHNRRPEGL